MVVFLNGYQINLLTTYQTKLIELDIEMRFF